MKFFSDRPLFTVCSALTTASFAVYYCGGIVKIIIISAAVLLAAALIIFKKAFRVAARNVAAVPVVLILSGIAAGTASSYLCFNVNADKIKSYSGTDGEITACVTKINYISDYSSQFIVDVLSVNGEKTDFKAALSTSFECDADLFDTLNLSVSFKEAEENIFGFPLRKYYASDEIFITAEGDDGIISVTPKEGDTVESFFVKLNARLSARLQILAGKDGGGLASGLLLGRRGAVADTLKRDFRRLGLSHMLSVSGLHLVILAGGFDLLLKKLRLGRYLRLAAVTVFILLFMCLIGFTYPVVRSGIMMIIMLFGRCIGRQNDSLTALSLAAAVILLVSPAAVIDVGFMMSFSATLGIITSGASASAALGRIFGGKNIFLRAMGKLLSAAAVTVSAVFFTLPFSWIYFGQISVVSVMTNLIFTIPATLLLYASALALIFYSTNASAFFGAGIKFLSGVIITLSDKLASYNFTVVSLRYSFTIFAFAAAALSVFLLLCMKKKKVYFYFFPALIWVLVFSGGCFTYYAQNYRNTEIIAENYKKNDMLIIHSKNKTVLCDISDGSYSPIKAAAYLSDTEFYDPDIDVFMLTHLHTKHISTFGRLAENTFLEYLIIPDPMTEGDVSVAAALEHSANEHKVKIMYYSASEEALVRFCDCEISLPQRTFIKRSAQPLICVTVKTNGGSFSYLGAAVFESPLASCCEKAAEESDAVFIGIHGPVIKQVLPEHIDFPLYTVVSSDSVNELYGTEFEILEQKNGISYRKYIFKKDSE